MADGSVVTFKKETHQLCVSVHVLQQKSDAEGQRADGDQ